MAIALTEKAAQQVRMQLAKRGHGIGLRLGVKKVGCSGFAYTYDYADQIGEGDVSFESFDAKVVVDKHNLGFLEGATLDFVREGLKQAFKVDNPNVDATCGCGESFSIKENAAVAPSPAPARS